MRFSPGDCFDRYIIESILGEGGAGQVYRATDRRLRREVAIKVLRQKEEIETFAWDRAVSSMTREARVAAALRHPNIVAIYDVGEHEGTPFIAMELVEGPSLRSLIGVPILLGERLRILLDVARALAAAHRAHLVHRDVKPENVMLHEDRTVKILDFGIARQMQEEPADEARRSTVTSDGAMVGTPAYMAPEQIVGDEIDARTDQFAWGVLAHELLSGRLPFPADMGTIRLLGAIVSDPPRPLLGVPEGVAAVVRRALEKDKAARFPSMDELAKALAPLVAAELAEPPPRVLPAPRSPFDSGIRTVLDAPPPPPPPRWHPWAERAAMGLALAVAIALLLHRMDTPAKATPAPAGARVSSALVASTCAAYHAMAATRGRGMDERGIAQLSARGAERMGCGARPRR